MFEGADATGKSTQASLLADRLGALLTREPGGTPLGERVRALLLDEASPAVNDRAEVMLMLAARAQHVADVIEPALSAGRDVVCDRFSGSTVAYQGYGRGLDPTELQRLSAWAEAGVEPDLTVLLQLDGAVAESRRVDRGAADRIEGQGKDFASRVADGFAAQAVADPGRWRVVDAAGSIDEVAEKVWKAVCGG
ncbi:MAG TPA: dTMP kinase [Acidimicrobiales bacterium]|nr:dTMP kinase [Acidimicrobiales bacterium]